VNRFEAFAFTYRWGVRVATGDTNGDGFTDVVVWTGRAGGVRVVSGADGSTLARFTPFGDGRVAGLRVALGDLDGNGSEEIVVARGGRNPEVRIFEGEVLIDSFPVFDSSVGGISVAVANRGVGPTIVVAAGRPEPIVRYYSIGGLPTGEYAPFQRAGSGLGLAAADLDGDGIDEVAVGRAGRDYQLRLFDDEDFGLVAETDAGPVVDRAFGIRLGVLRSRSGADKLLLASTPGEPLGIRAFLGLDDAPERLPPDRPDRAFGIFVG
jgi:hypothetical protein